MELTVVELSRSLLFEATESIFSSMAVSVASVKVSLSSEANCCLQLQRFGQFFHNRFKERCVPGEQAQLPAEPLGY